MTRFTVSDSLFGDSSIFYLDPISGKQKGMLCDPANVGNFKSLITTKIMRELAAWLYYDRSKVFEFLQKSNPHHITTGFRKGIMSLRVNIANMYVHEDANELASHISFFIIPDLLSPFIAPKKESQDAERYQKLATELEEITHEILNSDLLQNQEKTYAGKTAILVS